jgi:ferredoxin
MRVKLLPLGRTLEVAPGSTLDSILSAHGVEFPCGGAGICRGSRILILEGSNPVTPEMEGAFTLSRIHISEPTILR